MLERERTAMVLWTRGHAKEEDSAEATFRTLPTAEQLVFGFHRSPATALVPVVTETGSQEGYVLLATAGTQSNFGASALLEEPASTSETGSAKFQVSVWPVWVEVVIAKQINCVQSSKQEGLQERKVLLCRRFKVIQLS